MNPCQHCGWKEGDGIKACRYSSEFGQETHSNEHPMGLSPEQAELYQLYLESKHVAWISEAERERVIADTVAERATRVARNRAFGQSVLSEEEEAAQEAAWREWWITLQQAIPLQTKFHSGQWIAESFLDGRVFMYRQHKCGGHPVKPYGYRIGCTGCPLFIQLGDHGIDEDYG